MSSEQQRRLLVLVSLLAATSIVWLVATTPELDAGGRPRRHDLVEVEDEASAGQPLGGAVLGPGGRLVAGAVVDCPDAVTRTSALGLFRCEDVELPLRLRPRARGHAEPPPEVAAEIADARTDLRLRVRGPCRLRGHVVRGTAPAGGVRLRVQWLSADGAGGQPVAPFSRDIERTTDSHGAFDIEGLWPGRVRVVALDDGAAPAYSPLLDLADHQTLDGLLLTLGPGGTLTGTVRSLDGASVPGAMLRLADVHGGPEARSDLHGAFTLEALPIGTWVVEVEAVGFERLRESIEIQPHAAPSRAFVLRPLAGLQARVVDAQGQPVVGANVTLRTPGGQHHQRSDRLGEVQFGELPAGQRGVATADHPAHGVSEQVELQPGVRAELRLPSPGSIAGSVVDAQGNPVAHATLWLAPSANGDTPVVWGQQRAPEPARIDGQFVLRRVRAGSWDVRARVEGAPPGVVRGVRVEVGQAVEGVVVRLDGGATVEVRVRDAERRPALAALQLHCADDPTRTAQTDAQGQARMQDVTPGPCTLQVSCEGHLLEVRSLAVPDSGSERLTIDLRPAGAGNERELPRYGVALAEDERGLVVSRVAPGSGAARAGLEVGDRVVGIDFRRIGRQTLDEVVGDAHRPDGDGAPLTLEIEQGGLVTTVYLNAGASASP